MRVSNNKGPAKVANSKSTNVRTPFAFDNRAHAILTDLIDCAEEYLVERKKCPPKLANDRLCGDFIKSCADMMFGAQWYVAGDEIAGTEGFIMRLRGTNGKCCPSARLSDCTQQLLAFPQIYFPNYLTVLRMAYLVELRKMEKPSDVTMNGMMKMASANMPGVVNDVRRHLRSIGATYEPMIVHKDDLKKKDARFIREILPMNIDNTL